MILALNHYYALPGNEQAVLAQRRKACEVRAALGIPRGRVLLRLTGPDNLPTVAWEWECADEAAHEADMAVRAASPDFEAVRKGMRALYRRFDRVLLSITPAGAPWQPAAGTIVLACWDATEPLAPPPDGRRLERLTDPHDLPRFIRQSRHAGRDAALAAIEPRDGSVPSLWQVIE